MLMPSNQFLEGFLVLRLSTPNELTVLSSGGFPAGRLLATGNSNRCALLKRPWFWDAWHRRSVTL
jgi:hypothetical protein